MTLAKEKCIACNKDTGALSQAEAEQLLKEISGWQMLDDASLLIKEYNFRNFAEALAWVNKVSVLAEQEQHHPDIAFGWGYCTIALQTHSVGGLHRNDFVLAAKINQMAD